MNKLNIDELDNVAGGLTEEEQRLMEQAKQDAEDFADFGTDLWGNSKKQKGSLKYAKQLLNSVPKK